MYLCAKLVGVTVTVLSAGTISPLVIPYLKNSNNIWLFKKDPSAFGYNFQELDNTVKRRLEKLTHWFEKFSSAKTTTEGLKKLELEKMQPLFEKIFATETEVQALFDQISKSLTDLVKKNEDLVSNSIKRLEQKKHQQLQKTLNERYSTIKDILKEWKKSLSEISCAIDKQQESSKEEPCKQWTSEITNFFESVGSLFSSLMTQVDAGGGTRRTTTKWEFSNRGYKSTSRLKKS